MALALSLSLLDENADLDNDADFQQAVALSLLPLPEPETLRSVPLSWPMSPDMPYLGLTSKRQERELKGGAVRTGWLKRVYQ